jgi:hypothetical protein
MSARKADIQSSIPQVTVEARQTRLSLTPGSVIIHKNGIEFRSNAPLSPWTEMTISLSSPRDEGKINCTGVVIACRGNKHGGYHVSMVFTGLSKQAQVRLGMMAVSQLS